MPSETIKGLLEKVIFFNEENDYFVGELAVEGQKGTIKIQGKLGSPACGETLELTGGWVKSKYGDQFKFENYRQVLPSSLYGVRKFLASGIVKGIGPVFAEKIVNHFGADVLKVLDTQSGRLREIKGLGGTKAKALKDAWMTYRDLREAQIYLHSLGLGSAMCSKLIKRFGSAVQRLIGEQPYMLIGEVDRLGFKTIDQIALNSGISSTSPDRLRSGLEFAMSSAEDDGHTALGQPELIETASRLLGVEADRLDRPLIELVEAGLLLRIETSQGVILQSPKMYKYEATIADALRRMANCDDVLPPIDFDKAIVWAQNRAKIELTSDQVRGLREALKSKVAIITGGPGTGKTTVLKTLIEMLRVKGVMYALAAPTGRAAQRMTEATGAPAKTLHRLIGYSPDSHSWLHDEDHPLETEFLIVDETSMVDTPLMAALVKALPPQAHLLLVGDADQLPSVGPGEILHNLIASKLFAVVRLGKIFRQNEGLLLATAHNLVEGQKQPPLYQKVLENFDPQIDLNAFAALTPESAATATVRLCTEILPKRLGINPIRDIQVLVPMHRGEAGTINLNEKLQAALNPSKIAMTIGATRYHIGDKILQTRNNYDLDLFNGDIGIVESIDGLAGTVRVNFSGTRQTLDKQALLDTVLAYAISIHKSQGSEYPCVVVPLLRAHYTMLTRNLLYTALTRGKRHVIIVGDPSAYKLAASREQTNTRTTGLPLALENAFARVGKTSH
jgi:exodeoxyribonuclease V alpha subunit